MTRAITLITGLMGLALASIAAQAQDLGQYQVLIDADDNPASGCSFQPSGGDVLSGYEARLIATVDFGALEVIHVERQTCRDSAFAAAGSSSERYPVALNAGMSGSDSIELTAGRNSLGLDHASDIELAFVSDNAEGSDVIATTNGSPDGAALHLSLPIQVPALSPWALAGLALALLVLAWLTHRRLGRLGTLCVVMGVVTLAWAAHFAADGDISEWSGHSPAATDPSGDATDGGSTTDLLAVFTAVENNTLFFRLDVADIENDPPEAGNDAHAVDEDAVLDVAAPGVLDNDRDADGDALTAIVESEPDHAANFALNADGGFNYEPEPDFNGEDMFTYRATDGTSVSALATVAITVNPVEDAPEAAGDAHAVDEDEVLDIAAPGVLDNDSDADGDALTAIPESGPDHAASFTLNADGGFNYEPQPDYNGEDAFTYRASDGDLESDPATVTITVDAANDAPEVDDRTATTDEDVAVTVELTGNDTEGDALDFAAVDGPDHGSLDGVVGTGDTSAEVTYTPDADFNGTDSFTYSADDGTDTSDPATVTVTVDPVNDAPEADDLTATTDEDVAVTIELTGSDVDGDALDFAAVDGPDHGSFGGLASTGDQSAEVTYTPDADSNGDDSFTFTVDDGSETSDPATVTITVDPVNDPPEANADTAAITEQAPNTSDVNTVSGNVLANDTDPDSSAISVSSVEGADNNVGNPAASDYGSVTIDADGGYTYVLDDGNAAVDGLAPGETLTDSISYSAWDGSLADTTSLTVTIDGADDEAVAVDDEFTGIENSDCVLITPLDNDIDPDGGNLVALTSLPSLGSLHLVGDDGSAGALVLTGEQDSTEFCFVPKPFDYSNPETEVYVDFDYRLEPGGSEATVEIYIQEAPEPP